MSDYTIFPLGDQAVTISLGNSIKSSDHDKIMNMKHWFENHTFPGLVDIVVAYSSLTIIYDSYIVKSMGSSINPFDFVHNQIHLAFNDSIKSKPVIHPVIRIPVCYEDPFSPDMDFLCHEKQITKETVIELHTGKTYQVYMIGFLPGFPYMAEVDGRITMARKEKPRVKVEAGSVGIAGIQTGIYPVSSPGGWQIIGRTPLALFDKHADPPVKLEPGNSVQFYSITKKEFEDFKEYRA